MSFNGPGERRRHGHLLVEREPDQQRHRLLREQCVGLVVPVKYSRSGMALILDNLALSNATGRGLRLKGRIALVVLLGAAAAVLAGVARERALERLDGDGTVFFPNPVAQLQDQSLTDQKDADYAGAPARVPERHADQPRRQRLPDRRLGAGRQRDRRPGASATNTFTYHRNDDRFEQVMAYYWVTEAQKYIQSLGFGTGTFPPVNMESQRVRINQLGDDNSFATDHRRTSSASARAASTTPRTPR